jgi:LytR cell envelope-related transcriptional attenuator
VTKGEYPYPPDEFDAVDPSAGPRGVHRRPRSRWGTVWPFLVALAASAALAFVLVAYVWDERGPTPSAGTGDAAPDAVATEASPTETAPAEPAPTEPPAGEAPAAPTPVETTPAPPPSPDLGTPVTVFNSTSVQGLAADAADRLEDAGWSEVASGNYPGGTLPSSTVFYGSAELEVSARAVAEVLGISAVELAESDATDGIEVVLERDFVG